MDRGGCSHQLQSSCFVMAGTPATLKLRFKEDMAKIAIIGSRIRSQASLKVRLSIQMIQRQCRQLQQSRFKSPTLSEAWASLNSLAMTSTAKKCLAILNSHSSSSTGQLENSTSQVIHTIVPHSNTWQRTFQSTQSSTMCTLGTSQKSLEASGHTLQTSSSNRSYRHHIGAILRCISVTIATMMTFCMNLHGHNMPILSSHRSSGGTNTSCARNRLR